MPDLYIFSPDDKLLAILSNEAEGACAFWDAHFKEILNQGSTFEFTAQGDHEDSQYIIAENQVAFKDKDGDFRLFVMREIEEIDGDDGPQIHVICEPAMLELNDEIIEDKRPQNKTAKEAMTVALSGTRWKVGNVAELGTNSTNFYYVSVTEAIENIINIWGGELKDRITVDETGITGRYIDLLARRGADIGKVWEMDKDILQFKRQVQSYPKTALYGRGSSLETDDGGFTRKITFADVEWKKANGDPVDKPKGQEWVGDPEALALFGRKNADGSLRHRFGIFEDAEEEDPATLLKKTWEALQQQKNQVENFEMDVFLLGELIGYEHEKVRLGDTTFAINRNFAKPIKVEERVISFEYDVADPDNSGKVELGDYIDLFADDERLDKIEARLNDGAGIWNQAGDPVTDDSFPDIVPSVPTNFQADGLFKIIQLTWDFDPASYIAAYEVYASQVAGFTPDASNLVFRGKTGAYNHQADTNQQWYFRLRAINTHGTASGFTDEVMAQTAQVKYDDIEQAVTEGIEQAKQDAQDAVDTANQATQDAQTAIDQAQTAFDNAQDAISAANDAMNTANNASQVAGDATAQAQNALTQAQNAMSEAQKKADASSVYTKTEIDNALQSYATTTTVNTLTGRVDSAETAIQQNANAIQLKADQSTVDTLTGRVSTAEATLAAQADQIALRVTKADADAKYATQTALTATANSLTSSITAVQTDLNNLQIGGRNLVRDSMTFENLNPDSIVARGGVVVQNYVGNFSAVKCDVTWNGISFSANALYNMGKLLLGKTYTYSVTIKNETDIEIKISSFYMGIDSNGNRWDPIRNKDLGRLKPGEVKTLFDTIEITQDVITAIGYGPLNFTIQGANISSKSSGSLYFYMPKFELGNRATDWTPAPEDMATVVQFNTLSQTLDSTVSRIGNAEGNISALQQTASSLGTRITDAEGDISTLTQTVDGLQTTVSDVQGDISSLTQTANSLQSRMTTAEGNISTLTQTTDSLTSQISAKADQSWVSSQISQLSNDINLRVKKDDIINQINISTEGVLIDGKKIHITGETLIDNAVITAAMLKKAIITDEFISPNAKIDFAKIANVVITDAMINSISATKINSGSFSGKTFTGGTFIGAKFMSDTGSGFMSLTTHGIEFDDGTNTFSLSRTKVETNAVATNVANLYLAPKNGQEVRVVRYDDIPGDGQVSSYRYQNLRVFDVQIMGSGIRADSGSNLYLMAESSSGKEVWCTNKLGYNGGNTGFIPIRVQGVRTGYTNLYLQGNEIRAVSSGPDTWGDTSTPNYANFRSSTITIEHASEGPLLTFNMERGWQFRQNDTGQSASLALRALVGEKKFVVEGPDGSNALLVHTQNGGPGYVRVYGDFSVNGTKSALVDTVTYGKRLMYAIEAPDNRFMDVIEQILSPGEHWVELNPMFAETINGYSVFPIPQSGGSATILEREPTRFKVGVESDMAIPIAFWIYGKRIGYENEYMKEVVDAA